MKITFDEYQKLAMIIVQVFKEFEFKGLESVQQSQILDEVTKRIELGSEDGDYRATSIEKSIETSRKVANVIQYMITNENMLMVT